MKKIFAFLLAAVMLFSLAGCSELDALMNELPPLPTETVTTPEPTATPTPTPEPTPEPTPQPVATETERIQVYLKKTAHVSYAPDDESQVILNFSYVTPSVRIDSNPEAAAAISEELNLMDELFYTGTEDGGGLNNLLEMALDNYSYVKETGAEAGVEFSDARTVSVARADSTVISFLYQTSSYYGGAHGLYGYTGENFDSVSGKRLYLEELSDDTAALKSVLTAAIIEEAKADPALYEEISSFCQDADGSLAALVREGSWYFDGNGMVFIPTLYELCSYASGIHTFTVSYEKLRGVINERFLPAGRVAAGEWSVCRLSEAEDGTVESIDKLVVDDGGEELYLIAVGTVYDVSISSVEYVDAGRRFYDKDSYWYASSMTDCALQLAVMIPDGMPELMIRYTDENRAEHRLLLSESGEDGRVILVDDSIEAVG